MMLLMIDPKLAATTLKVLQVMNSIMAKLLIDYYEAHT